MYIIECRTELEVTPAMLREFLKVAPIHPYASEFTFIVADASRRERLAALGSGSVESGPFGEVSAGGIDLRKLLEAPAVLPLSDDEGISLGGIDSTWKKSAAMHLSMTIVRDRISVMLDEHLSLNDAGQMLDRLNQTDSWTAVAV